MIKGKIALVLRDDGRLDIHRSYDKLTPPEISCLITNLEILKQELINGYKVLLKRANDNPKY